VRTLRRFSARAGRNRVTGVGRGLTPGRYVIVVRAAFGVALVARTAVLRVTAPPG
jgi:hypothetical protein